MLTVNEIFHSVQGESTRAGVRCVFVRLTACDLRCSWCDTPYAFHEGRKMSIQEVLETVASYECPTVELTGGEPLLQKDVYPLMGALLEAGHTVLIETGGHVNIGQVPADVIKIVDVKCPGSGEAHRMDWSNLERLRPHDEVKFVIRDRADYEYACDVVRRHDLAPRAAAVHFSPVHGELSPRTLSEWMLADRLPARLQGQRRKQLTHLPRALWRCGALAPTAAARRRQSPPRRIRREAARAERSRAAERRMKESTAARCESHRRGGGAWRLRRRD